jgi:hypothetical protein
LGETGNEKTNNAQISYGEVQSQEIKRGREGKEQYRVEILNRFAALENLDADVNIKALGKLLEKISKLQPKSLGYYELKKHKPWFDEGCYKLL